MSSGIRTDFGEIAAHAIVMDLGAYHGRWAEAMQAAYPATCIHAFEPVAEFAAIAASRLPRVEVHPYGLAAADGTAAINVNNDGSSLFVFKGAPQQTIELRGIDGWLEDNGIGAIAAMKINIEGAEYELLEHMLAAGVLLRIDHLLVQFHYFMPDAIPRARAIVEAINATHEFVDRDHFCWGYWRRQA